MYILITQISAEKYTCIYNIQIDFKAVFFKKLHCGVGRKKKPQKSPDMIYMGMGKYLSLKLTKFQDMNKCFGEQRRPWVLIVCFYLIFNIVQKL